MERYVYNYSRIILVAPPTKPVKFSNEFPWWLVALILVLAVMAVCVHLLRRRGILIPFWLFRRTSRMRTMVNIPKGK
jgi:hypothetical protein